ncbi:hypothetical protein BO71DRAFT_27483 [Aspergillus ellipticus CBS 707.79]|uniref:Uncharacterized protein n=1 Tax=Aspergillus ellipticus CBS 707.79 TaxID=1448320 RepID=A0A319D560_9EURO|nr:hypothetical protein BO71DRAFT_27483 [Aspergillus ellipticus CBS 707.79]
MRSTFTLGSTSPDFHLLHFSLPAVRHRDQKQKRTRWGRWLNIPMCWMCWICWILLYGNRLQNGYALTRERNLTHCKLIFLCELI